MAGIKSRYATALLELSQEKGNLEQDLEQAILVRDALNNNDVQDFLVHPYIPDTQKYELFENAFSKDVSNDLMGLLHLMVQNNRESLIVPTFNEYIERANRSLNRTEAKVVSATPLAEEQIDAIRRLLAQRIDMQVNITATVDPDVIGGFYILVEGHIFDGTIRSKLNNMRERLKRGSFEC